MRKDNLPNPKDRVWTKDREIANWLRQCIGKTKYASAQAAEYQGKVAARAYRCKICGAWHRTKRLQK